MLYQSCHNSYILIAHFLSVSLREVMAFLQNLRRSHAHNGADISRGSKTKRDYGKRMRFW